MGLWISLWIWGCASSKTTDDSGTASEDDTTDTDTNDTNDTNDSDDTGAPVDDLDCDTLPWTYENVGAPFMSTWCTSCHSGDLEEDQRAGAPVSVNFDSQAEVQAWIPNILNRIYNEVTPMPPVGDPPEDDLQRVADWLRCDAP